MYQLCLDQEVTDNCSATVTVPGVESGSADLCNGGEITREWTHQDDCGNEVRHTQTITIDPLTMPDYVNPPPDITIACDETLPAAIDLMISNGGTGSCLVEDTVTPTTDGSHDPCGAMVTYTWEYTDPCNNTIDYEQTIEVTPASTPVLIGAPDDVTITCDETIPPAMNLGYTNGAAGACLIEGDIVPVVDGTFDPCGSTITYTWEFTDMCGNDLEHVQTIELEPANQATFINPPSDVTIACDGVIPDPITLDYTNGQSGVCEIAGSEDPVQDGSFDVCGTTITYTWEFTDQCGNDISHVQNITIEPADMADFINLPPDESISCDQLETYEFADLEYTNNLSGGCLINGMVAATITDNTSDCEGSLEGEWEFTDDCGRTITYTQTVLLTPPAEVFFQNVPGDITVACDAVPTNPETLFYTNSDTGECLIEGNEDPMVTEAYDACGGTITYNWEFTDECNRTISAEQTVTIDPASEPTFLNAPEDVTLSCGDFVDFEAVDLDYTNSETGECEIAGTVSPTESGDIDGCGGVIMYEWEFTDDCGRTFTHTQEVTVDPAAPAVFLNVPDDMTLDCSEYDDSPPSLDYDNGATGVCRLEGEEDAIESGVVDVCGGVITYTWTFTDDCNRTATETQTITFLPAPNPEFIDPPEDITVECDEDFPDVEDLEFDNGESDDCEISGEVSPTLVQTDNIFEYTWEFVNICTDEDITHTQTITHLIPIELAEDEFEFELCIGGEFDLSEIFIEDLNGGNLTFTYHTSNPNDFNEIDPIVILDEEEEDYFIRAENEYGCFEVVEVELISEVSESAGEDVEDEICIDEEFMDLFSYLDNGVSYDGEFTQTDGPVQLDIFSPDEVNIIEAEAGTYTFEYSLEGDNGCPPDLAIIEIEMYASIQVDLISIECDASGDTYTLVITNNSYNVRPSSGTIISETPTEITIGNIPITDDITLEVEDDNRCEGEFSFVHPDCDCPQVAAPMSGVNQQICEGSTIPALTVTVGSDETANWYDMATGGTLLLENSLSYTPTETLAGLYRYYVEAESTLQEGCVSATRTEITLEIVSGPTVQDTFLFVCQQMGMATVTLDRSDVENVVFNNLSSLTAAFFRTQSDLQNNQNEIVFPYDSDGSDLFVNVSNSIGCNTIIDLEIRIVAQPEITADVIDETCLGAEDGSIDFSVSHTLPYEIFYRNNTIREEPLTGLRPGMHTLTVVDSIGCESEAVMLTIQEGMELFFENVVVTCDDNGTNTDSTDDFYLVSLSVGNTLGTTGMYQLFNNIDNTTEDYIYDEEVVITVSASGDELELTATDGAFGCDQTLNLGNLEPCSSDCEITINVLEYTCNGNGTEFDPSDDFYDVTINASAVNGSSNNTYNVLLDGVISHSFSYDMDNSFTLSADGSAVEIRIQDSQVGACFISEFTTALNPCSDACELSLEWQEVICDNAGTLEDESDDLFSYAYVIEDLNGSANGYLTAQGGTANYGDTVRVDNNLIAGGDIQISIVDADDPSCILDFTITAPEPCSQPCTIEFVSFSAEPCDDGGTNTDPVDDTYSVNFEVTSTDGVTTQFIVTNTDGMQFGPFDYDMPIELGPFVADGTQQSFTITDLTNTTCFLEEIYTVESCSDDCVVDAVIVDIICDNNDTEGSNEDDLFSVDLLVDGVNTQSGSYVIESLGVNEPFGALYRIENLLISDGSFSVVISDAMNASCFTEIMIDPPAPCSDPCEVDLVSLDILACDSNGTGITDDDDFYFIDIEVTAVEGAGAEYTLRDNLGNSYGPFSYDQLVQVGPFIADGSTFTLSLIDQANGSCALSFDISNQPCSSCPQSIDVMADVLLLDCDNTESNITLTSSETPVSVTWSSANGFGGSTNDIVVTQEGEYTVVVEFSDGCMLSESITIEVDDDVPTADAGPDQLLNCDTDMVTLSATSVNAGTNSTIEWLDENNVVISTDSELVVTDAGTYGVRVTDPNTGCISPIDFVTVTEDYTIPSDQIYADPDSIFNCFVQSITLTAEGEDNTIYTWLLDDGSITDVSVTVSSQIDSIQLIALNTVSGCDIERTMYLADLTEYPLINLENVGVLDCIAGERCVTASSPSTNPIGYVWYDENGDVVSQGSETFCVTLPGNYTVELTDEVNGCMNSESFEIEGPVIPTIDLPSVINLTNGQDFVLTPELNVDESQLTRIEWTSDAILSCYDCLVTTIQSYEDGDIATLTIETDDGCETRASVTIRVDDLTRVFIPNVFDPDDGDNFTIYASEQIELIEELRIYDRWGNLIFFNQNFSPNDETIGWDGTMDGKRLEQGVYVYVFIYQLDGRREVDAGDLTLLR